ncbi:hypothetical protein [Flaviaesturariibacter aridisoli]|uniref:DUF349 domain-containing protein n=1 Tax=Flaviaesturariibacter aridisoli TaxID=2545761 RepID=A0A4R4E5D5_9BACT|nr:hypothetical protein [Flaviaesturariibacter aridisoli]TCZ73950.1 hypothetical protein E0486_04520 [Flaviaesturariibacter aridisoli]
MYPSTTVTDLHREYQQWMNELHFHEQELCIFEKHLDRYAHDPARVQSEPFRQRFSRHRAAIRLLKLGLRGSEEQLADFARAMSGMGLDSVRMDNHTGLRGELEQLRVQYAGLKNEFRRAEAEWK